VSDMTQAASSALHCGLSILPVGRPDWEMTTEDGIINLNKKPAILDHGKPKLFSWNRYKNERPMTEEEVRRYFAGVEYLGVACGKTSGNLEVIDFDLAGIFDSWATVLKELGGEAVFKKLVIQNTQREGCKHVLYRCDEIEGNQKLARYYTETGEIKASIETRGQGGYIVACPSPGYKMFQGSFRKIPTLTKDERDLLIKAAKFLDVYVEEPTRVAKPDAGAPGLRPGDDYNRRADWRQILESAGGRHVHTHGGREFYCRPGKNGRDWSATTGNGFGDKDLLKVFSSNWAPFEPDGVYDKFSAYALINHGGNYEAAARELGKQGYGEAPQKPTDLVGAGSVAEAGERSPGAGRKWNAVPYSVLSRRPKKPMLLDGLIGERDNGMIYGQPKSGKTFVVVDLLLSCVCGGSFAGTFDAARPLTVAYFTNEGLGSFHERLRSCQDFNAIPYEDIEQNLLVFEDVPQLYSSEGTATIGSFVSEWETYESRHIDLIVIDTLNKATLGSDENSNSDAAQVSTHLLNARRRLGCATLLVHHSGKDGSKVRGASAYDGDLDFQLKVEKDQAVRILSLEFAKDLQGFEDLAFKLTAVNESAAVGWIGSREVSEKMNAIAHIELLMRQYPEKEWWTLGQIRDLLPSFSIDTIRKACAREVNQRGDRNALLDALIDADGNRLAQYRSKHLWS